MNYAVGLYFDHASKEKLSRLTRQIAQSGVNTYMLDQKIPPHITLACVCAEQSQHMIDRLDENIAGFHQGDIFWASLGIFLPAVLFATPVMNEYLLDFNAQVNRLLEPLGSAGENGYYLPNQWVPHTALAVRMNRDELKLALNAVIDDFTAFGGKAERLFLAQCNPYVELKTWNLS
jgi:2'-5' RNA ligase